MPLTASELEMLPSMMLNTYDNAELRMFKKISSQMANGNFHERNWAAIKYQGYHTKPD